MTEQPKPCPACHEAPYQPRPDTCYCQNDKCFMYAVEYLVGLWNVRAADGCVGCGYCGEVIIESWQSMSNEETDRRLFEHDSTCERNPLLVENRKLKARVKELEAIVENNRPYWLWRAMLEECKFHDCMGTPDGEECEESDACITEWCVPCAARKFLADLESEAT